MAFFIWYAKRYIQQFYNQERPHQALDYQVPAKVFGKLD